jgi:squalene-associated FAD-dependent desaturase
VTQPRVAVVGGGLAGLASALACADAGASVVLLEARPWLGGATWSTRLQGLHVDNGQHVFLRCCTAYRAFLERLGAAERVTLQPRLALPVVGPGGRVAWLRRHPLPAPLHLAPSLLRFRHLPLADRLRIAVVARRLAALDLADPALDELSFGAWLEGCGQPRVVIDRFWDLIARPTLNLPAGEASLALATKVFQTGLLSRADAADLGWALRPLNEVHAEPAAAALERAGVELRLRARVAHIEACSAGGFGIRLPEGRLEADTVVLAVPHGAAGGLAPPGAGFDAASLRPLGVSPIVNLHVVFERPVTQLPFAAAIDSPLQYVFDRTRSAGLPRGQYLAVSLSAAEEFVGASRSELERRFAPEFARLFPAARDARIERCFVTCEREATFRQAAGTARLRPGPRTRLPGLALAGAWTRTDWPDTMEGAVRSGLAAAHEALRAVGQSRSLPERAA